MEKTAKIYVAGHRGLVGNALCKVLQQKGYTNLIYRTHAELDLTNQQAVEAFFEEERPEYVFLAAAKVGGIVANNTYRGAFIYENMMIQNNVIHQSYVHGVKKLLFLGSTCIYPKECPQPMREDALLTGPLEYTNEPYAIAKIAGIKMCESYNLQYGTNFISVMPTNLYGPNDNFDLETSHVLPAMIRKFHEAKENNHSKVTLWGSGSPLREFLHVDDLGQVVLFALEHKLDDYIFNVGSGSDLTVKALAGMIQKVVDHKGEVIWDDTKPDGTPKKLMDSSKLNAKGWSSTINLEKGIKTTYEWFLNHIESFKEINFN